MFLVSFLSALGIWSVQFGQQKTLGHGTFACLIPQTPAILGTIQQTPDPPPLGHHGQLLPVQTQHIGFDAVARQAEALHQGQAVRMVAAFDQ
jgi:hypothetical protein